jgi:hypothetical protein
LEFCGQVGVSLAQVVNPDAQQLANFIQRSEGEGLGIVFPSAVGFLGNLEALGHIRLRVAPQHPKAAQPFGNGRKK